MKMKKNPSPTQSNQQQNKVQTEPLHVSLAENIQNIKKDLGSSDDIIIREICIGNERSMKIAVLYTDGLADKQTITDFFMESLMQETN